MATTEELTAALRKQGVTNIDRINIRRRQRTNLDQDLHPHIQSPPCSQGRENWLLSPESSFQHSQDASNSTDMDTTGKLVEDKTCVRDMNHIKDCLKEIRYPHCRQDDPAYSRSRNVYKKEKEILQGKHKRNITLLEGKKIVGSNTVESIFDSEWIHPLSNNQDNKYSVQVKKLIQLVPNEHLKKLHSAEFQQAQT